MHSKKTWSEINSDKWSDIVGHLHRLAKQGDLVYLRIISKTHGSFYCSLNPEIFLEIEHPEGVYFEKRRLGSNDEENFIEMSDIKEISIC